MQISSESWASGKFQDYCAAMCTPGVGGRRENNKSGLSDSNMLLFLTGETEWGPLWILGAIQLEGEVAMGARTTECIKFIFGRKLEFSKSGGEWGNERPFGEELEPGEVHGWWQDSFN